VLRRGENGTGGVTQMTILPRGSRAADSENMRRHVTLRNHTLSDALPETVQM